MEIWRAEPGDVVRLPASCYPRIVVVTDREYAPGECNRIHWVADGAHGPVVLLEVELLDTERPDKQVFVTPDSQPELEAEL
jgi:hypothetical protein